MRGVQGRKPRHAFRRVGMARTGKTPTRHVGHVGAEEKRMRKGLRKKRPHNAGSGVRSLFIGRVVRCCQHVVLTLSHIWKMARGGFPWAVSTLTQIRVHGIASPEKKFSQNLQNLPAEVFGVCRRDGLGDFTATGPWHAHDFSCLSEVLGLSASAAVRLFSGRLHRPAGAGHINGFGLACMIARRSKERHV